MVWPQFLESRLLKGQRRLSLGQNHTDQTQRPLGDWAASGRCFRRFICLGGNEWGSLIALGLGLFWVGVWWLDDHWGEIQVDENYLTSRGKKPVRLAWAEIHSLAYRVGGEDEPTGLYAGTGRWTNICVMANLDREQSDEIIAKIHGRFPKLSMAEEPEPLFDRFRSWLGWSNSSKDGS